MRLSDFAGDWDLTRRIDDALTGQQGRFTGTATFTQQADGMDYRETGTLRLGGSPPMTAVRRYVWADSGDAIAVFFDDGAPFHSFAKDGDGVGTPHLCGADLYRVRYDFRDWPVWQARWDVKGPRKSYCLVSRYAPLTR
ncbi:MAG: DUF6314 family protein [Loktanella sp.]|nr:DUF6314 family protein [Loktanella sp.]